MNRAFTALFVGLLVSVMTCGSVWAQATAQISGAVQDQSGAVLPGAEITATQTDTGISRMTITNETGYYVLPNLPLGPYRLRRVCRGSARLCRRELFLQVNSNPTINVVLQVGQVSEQVEVQAQCVAGGDAQCQRRSSHGNGAHHGTPAQRPQRARVVAAGRRRGAGGPAGGIELPRQDADFQRRHSGHFDGVHTRRDSPCRSL